MGEVLDLGCGATKTPGAFGVDLRPLPGVDLAHDLNVRPWPLANDRFEAVVCNHVLEHLDEPAGVMAEIHRVARRGARVKIVTPHFSSLNSWEDPTHRRHFARRSFDFFDGERGGTYAGKGGGFRRLSVAVSFGGGFWDFLGKLHYRLWPNFWEKQLSFIWRGRNLTVELEVHKLPNGNKSTANKAGDA